jgi:hypothetical protein
MEGTTNFATLFVVSEINKQVRMSETTFLATREYANFFGGDARTRMLHRARKVKTYLTSRNRGPCLYLGAFSEDVKVQR